MSLNPQLTENESQSTLDKIINEAAAAPRVEATSMPSKKTIRPPKAGETWRVREQDKQLIVSLWASGLTASEVVEKAQNEFNINVSRWNILQYTRAIKWQKLIKKIKQETYADIASVAGSHKKVRLERGEMIYEKAMSKNNFKDALAATEHQRKEMEGGGDVNVTLNQFNMLSDEELEFKKKELIERIALKNKGVIDVKPANQAETTGA